MTDPDLPLSASRPLLLPEALGFSPQLLLDDIINIANNAVQDGVNAPSVDMESVQEVEQGLVAFQTLLEYHTDIAFDFFEAWSLRNIFAVPPDLDVILPHHEGLDLSADKLYAEEREKELAGEIEDLRAKIDNQRLAKRQLTRAMRISAARRRRAEQCFVALSTLLPSSFSTLGDVPSKVIDLFGTISSLQPLEPPFESSLSQSSQPEAGKRPWESSKTGYINWVVAKLVERARESGKFDVNNFQAGAEAVAKMEFLKGAFQNSHRVLGEGKDR
ncbi:hypothetical protein APHAL10511_000055 [Amanita phalloides]|nr:hypothetical protein APHAL10511_000055 [Amanita phalloides]